MSIVNANQDAPDFLGVNPVGGNLLAPFTALNVPAGQSANSGFFYVGNLRSLVIYYQWQSGGELAIQPAWWAAPNVSHITFGNVQQALTASTQQHFWQVPVVAPFFQLSAFNANGPAAVIEYGIFGVMDSAPGAQFFPCQALIHVQGDPLAANGINNYVPAISTPGRYQAWANCAQNFLMFVQRLNGLGTFDFQVGENGVSGAQGVAFDFNVGVDDWRFQISNSTGVATSINLVVMGPQP